MAHFPTHVDREALEGAAIEGLVRAAERFDSTKGSFRTYAAWRIKGAVIDHLRQLTKSRDGTASASFSSLDDLTDTGKEMPDRMATDAIDAIHNNARHQIMEAMSTLAPRHRLVLTFLHFYEMSQVEIAAVYGVTGSAVSQWVKAASRQIAEGVGIEPTQAVA